MKITLIAGIGKNNELGAGNKLLWDLPADMKHFRTTTKGKPVIMGRKTFESIGRPLPKRRNIVITRNTDFSVTGVETVSSLEEALSITASEEEVFIIGGAQIYELAIDSATHLNISHVEADFPEADTFFPNISLKEWEETSRTHFPKNEENSYNFDVVQYKRKKF